MSKAPGCSPYGGWKHPAEVFRGDTHLNTSNLLDPRCFGVILGPEEAFRLARGDEVVITHGEPLKLSHPLDWLVVSDHSEVIISFSEGNPPLSNPTATDIVFKRSVEATLGATPNAVMPALSRHRSSHCRPEGINQGVFERLPFACLAYPEALILWQQLSDRLCRNPL